MRTLLIQNCAVEGFGIYESFLVERGLPYDVVRSFETSLPSLAPYGAIMVGGTPDAVYERGRLPYLAAVHSFLASAAEEGVPCLGICAGAQLLASALGAEVRPHRTKEIGVSGVVLTPAGEEDPILRGFPGSFEVFQWHGDTFGIPEGGHLLARGSVCTNQMFKYENVVGTQFHLETTRSEALRWADVYGPELAAMGKTAADIRNEFQGREETMTSLALRLMENFFAAV